MRCASNEDGGVGDQFIYNIPLKLCFCSPPCQHLHATCKHFCPPNEAGALCPFWVRNLHQKRPFTATWHHALWRTFLIGTRCGYPMWMDAAKRRMIWRQPDVVCGQSVWPSSVKGRSRHRWSNLALLSFKNSACWQPVHTWPKDTLSLKESLPFIEVT